MHERKGEFGILSFAPTWKMGMVHELQYRGHRIVLTVLPEQGRWAYRVDNGPIRSLETLRAAMCEEVLAREAELRAKADIDLADRCWGFHTVLV